MQNIYQEIDGMIQKFINPSDGVSAFASKLAIYA
jgi:hypothetical protein